MRMHIHDTIAVIPAASIPLLDDEFDQFDVLPPEEDAIHEFHLTPLHEDL